VTEQETGYITADTLQGKVLIYYTLAAEVGRHGSLIREGMSAAKGTRIATAVARLKAVGSLPHHAREQVGKASRVSSMNGHE
jgi:hypothetical protein